jgi:hypothetical protein
MRIVDRRRDLIGSENRPSRILHKVMVREHLAQIERTRPQEIIGHGLLGAEQARIDRMETVDVGGQILGIVAESVAVRSASAPFSPVLS